MIRKSSPELNLARSEAESGERPAKQFPCGCRPPDFAGADRISRKMIFLDTESATQPRRLCRAISS